METKKLLQELENEINQIETSHRSVLLSKLANKYYLNQ